MPNQNSKNAVITKNMSRMNREYFTDSFSITILLIGKQLEVSSWY